MLAADQAVCGRPGMFAADQAVSGWPGIVDPPPLLPDEPPAMPDPSSCVISSGSPADRLGGVRLASTSVGVTGAPDASSAAPRSMLLSVMTPPVDCVARGLPVRTAN
jgi:hypothetical protein